MTTDEIIKLAREADPFGEHGRLYQVAALTPETLARFASLVRAAALEEAAAEIEALRAALKMKTAGDEYAHRLAVMLECALLDRRGTWDAAHALLDEYRAACRAVDEPPTVMGEPLTPNARHKPRGEAGSA